MCVCVLFFCFVGASHPYPPKEGPDPFTPNVRNHPNMGTIASNLGVIVSGYPLLVGFKEKPSKRRGPKKSRRGPPGMLGFLQSHVF